jgi:hypothetical protein
MELPQELKELYRHWSGHVFVGKKMKSGVPKEVDWFIAERIRMWEQKTAGLPPPYTDDSILAQYRFCNIFREFDKQTIEFHTLLNPLRDDFPLWLLNMFYCRMVARTETIRSVGLLSFDKKKNKEVYRKLMESPRPRYGTPYVFPVSVIQRTKYPTREIFLCEYLPLITEKIALEIETWHKKSVFDGVEKILPIFGYNLRFLWTEVCIDAAYQYPERIDLFSRFPIGPGSLPTFKKLDATSDSSIFVQRLAERNTCTSVTFEKKPLRLSSENWEGIGCEYRKYTNLIQGKGRRRIYRVGP